MFYKWPRASEFHESGFDF